VKKTSGHERREGEERGSFIQTGLPETSVSFLASIAGILSSNDRILPGMLIHYSDILFKPRLRTTLGYALASDFANREPDVVMTSEVKGIPLAIFTAHALGGSNGGVPLPEPARDGRGRGRSLSLGKR
jgi:purine operon repressor